ncbi:MAG: hypothetical protein Q9183_005392 [Haloplaca sp. 2 TL-2023]
MDGEGQQTSRPVPRFASFRPPANPILARESERGYGSAKHVSTEDDSKGIRKHRHRSRRQENHASTSGLSPKPLPAPDSHFIQWDDSPDYYVVDVKGDLESLNYGKSHGVPSYHRSKLHMPLGSRNAHQWNSHPGRANRERNSLLGHIRHDLKRQTCLHIKHDPSIGARDVLEADFVPLRTSRRRKRQRRDGPDDRSSLSLSERSTDASDSEEESGMSTSNENFQQRKAGLSKQIDQNPTDWRTWIALAELQDEVDGVLDTVNQHALTNAERRSNAEVTLSIYQKALKNVADPKGRERLYLGMMSKASVVWERAKLSAQWKTIQNEHPFSLPLWKSYLDFHQSTLHSFRLEDVRKRFQDGLDSLQKARDRQSLSQTQISDIYVVQIYFVLRLSLLLRQGGYSEVGLAIWQALLEFEYNRPSHLSHMKPDERDQSRHSESVLEFEAFWDSEVPRIGEPNANGWSNFGDDDIELPQAHAEDGACIQGNSNHIKAWADAERKAQDSSIIPGRTLDETSDDPYRVVLFSDINISLFLSAPILLQRSSQQDG